MDRTLLKSFEDWLVVHDKYSTKHPELAVEMETVGNPTSYPCLMLDCWYVDCDGLDEISIVEYVYPSDFGS